MMEVRGRPCSNENSTSVKEDLTENGIYALRLVNSELEFTTQTRGRWIAVLGEEGRDGTTGSRETRSTR